MEHRGAAQGVGDERPAQERDDRDRDHDRNEHRGDAVGEALDRCLRCLGRLQETDDLSELGVPAGPGHEHDDPAVAVDRGPHDVGAGADVDEEDSPVSRDRSTHDVPTLTTPSAGTFSRPDNEVAGLQLLDRDRALAAVLDEGRLLGAALDQGADGVGRTGAGAARVRGRAGSGSR